MRILGAEYMETNRSKDISTPINGFCFEILLIGLSQCKLRWSQWIQIRILPFSRQESLPQFPDGNHQPSMDPASYVVALWRTAPGDAVLKRSIENRCRKNSEGPASQHANLGTKQGISFCSPLSTFCRRYIIISIRTIFYLNSLNIKICVSQRSRESNGVGFRVVMRIT